jgi:fatty-acyl-CoA synthase
VLAALDNDERALTFLQGGEQVRISYREIEALTADLAARWAGLSIRPGDRVVLVVADEREFVLAFLSALRTGVVPVPVYPPFMLGQLDAYLDGLRHVCRTYGARLCIASEVLMPLLGPGSLPCPVDSFASLLAARRGDIGSPAPGDVAFLQFTSGSTGDPKGVIVTHGSLLANAHVIGRHGLAVDGAVDRAVSWLPLYHDMGLIGFLFVPLLTQASIWYLPPLEFARAPMTWVRWISDVRATVAFAPNFAYGLLAKRATTAPMDGIDLSAWRVAGCGAEPVQADTLRQFARAFAGVGFEPKAFMPSYGLAEATLAVAMRPRGTGMATLTVDGDRLAGEGIAVDADESAERRVELVSCGRPLKGVEVVVVDIAGRRVADGHEGEVVVCGTSLAAGYFGDAERSAQSWRDGWLHTGDLGFLHGGELYITGRIKDTLVINGRNHHPHDIERVAGEVPGVRPGNVVAIGTPSEHTEGVRLVLEPRDVKRSAELPALVRRAVRNQLGITVQDVVMLPPKRLPKTSSGKLRRAVTAALLDQGRLETTGGGGGHAG